MKKILAALIFSLFISHSVLAAEILRAKALTPISTKHPSEFISVQVVSDIEINGNLFEKGFILSGKMINVVQPQAMCKNATFTFEILEYKDLNGNVQELSSPIKVKYRQQMRPNLERSSITIGDTDDSGFVFSPKDIEIAKESSSVGDFLKKEMIKDSPFDTGWDIELKKGDSIKFNIQ